MKASRTLTSLVAAAAVAGSIGLAYAQTTAPDTTTPSAAPTTPAMPAATGNQGTTTTTTTTTPSAMPTTTGPAGMQTERAAQADRN